MKRLKIEVTELPDNVLNYDIESEGMRKQEIIGILFEAMNMIREKKKDDENKS